MGSPSQQRLQHLRMQIRGLHLTPAQSETLRLSPTAHVSTSPPGDSDAHLRSGKRIQGQYCRGLGGNVRFRTSELEAPLANRPKATSSNQILISNKGDDVIFRIIVIITFENGQVT